MNTETNSLPDPPSIVVKWREELRFEAEVPSGQRIEFDAVGEGHDHPTAPSPLEAFLSSAAACSAMDVISVLLKKRQTVTAYRVVVTWKRHSEGEWPHPITEIELQHLLTGENLDPEAVRHAVELSDEKYCTVVATLRTAPTVTAHFKIAP